MFHSLVLLFSALFVSGNASGIAQSPDGSGEEFLSRFLVEFTEECKDFRGKVSSSGMEPDEPSPAFVEADLRMAKVVLSELLMVRQGIIDPYPNQLISLPIITELYFHYRWNDIEDPEKLYTLKKFSDGVFHHQEWQCFEVTKHCFLPNMDSIVYLTVAKQDGAWKIAAMSRETPLCVAAESSGLNRVGSLHPSLRYIKRGDVRLTYLRLKSGNEEQPRPQTVWKGRKTEFSASSLHSFLNVEVDPYDFEQVFLADADFPFSGFTALAQLRCGTQWDFSLFVPGPMDGILYRIPVTLISARSSDRKLVTAEGRIVVSWAAFMGHKTMQDFIDGLLPVLEGWSPAPSPEEQNPVPPQEERPSSGDPSDQETLR